MESVVGVFDASGAKVRLEIKTFDGSVFGENISCVGCKSQIKHEPQRHSTIEKADYKKPSALQALQT